jgi:hypothetical protein
VFREGLQLQALARISIIAESDLFELLSPGSLITPGFGGRVYFPTGKGFIVLQVMPKPSSPSSK